jgi:hypothetical protein
LAELAEGLARLEHNVASQLMTVLYPGGYVIADWHRLMEELRAPIPEEVRYG